jgi:hypothetical protein
MWVRTKSPPEHVVATDLGIGETTSPSPPRLPAMPNRFVHTSIDAPGNALAGWRWTNMSPPSLAGRVTVGPPYYSVYPLPFGVSNIGTGADKAMDRMGGRGFPSVRGDLVTALQRSCVKTWVRSAVRLRLRARNEYILSEK